ncbi:MAG: hypothetical protein PHS79_04220 [Patescibacteria group bacterium]|nr:hypothetical protein [Patescibacteria group bacterium]
MTTMTIAQALRRIKKNKGRVAELKARATQSVSYEAGKKPVFDFKALRENLSKTKEELIRLEAAVTVANANARILFEGRDMPLAEAVRRLQELKDDMSWLPQLNVREGVERVADYEFDPEKERQIRVTRETVWASELSELERVSEIDSLRDRFERLNDLVEQANHRTEVAPT